MARTTTTCADHNEPNFHESDYLGWHAWAEKHSEKHYQVRCDECGLFKIWRETKSDA